MTIAAVSEEEAPPYANGKLVLQRDQRLLQAPHTSVDGRELMLIVNDLLKIVTSLQKEQPSYPIVNLSPPFRVAASIPPIDNYDSRRATIPDKRWNDQAPKRTI
ncbi:hypothetical protein N7491_008329 [Penicillium cf. griseofulvum]|uniref:Uncharacterized protein n=1 Tax=Penicillium cf. griseofulvum TaxID=2972120 RepID=A0A9W9SVV9_9EURO|nr:hypothetical protein N7472_006071 [Penicillium cf. griseofulvum]KAJ5423113.1 hypothetical protein N7491_008329 [Penicillium cf. griseofulvum]